MKKLHIVCSLVFSKLSQVKQEQALQIDVEQLNDNVNQT
jgi:hypothetical protein